MRIPTRNEARSVMFDARPGPTSRPAGSDLSVHAREVTKKRVPVLCNAGPYSPAGKLLHGDELAFKQRIKFFPLGNLVGRVPDQWGYHRQAMRLALSIGPAYWRKTAHLGTSATSRLTCRRDSRQLTGEAQANSRIAIHEDGRSEMLCGSSRR